MKKEKDIIQMLKNMEEPAVDGYTKKMAVNEILLNFSRQPVGTSAPFWERLLRQAEYISPLTWGMQLILFLCVTWLLNRIGYSQPVILMTAATAAPLFALVGCTEIARSFSHNMWELEQSSRYNLRYLLGMKMLLLGLMDLILFSGLLAVSIGRGGMFWQTAFCLLAPFNLANTVYLMMLFFTGGRCPLQLLFAAGIAMMIAVAYFGSSCLNLVNIWQELFGKLWTGGLLAATFLGMFRMIYVFLVSDRWGEERVWN